MLSTVALISGLYDLVVGAFLLLAADRLASLFGVPPASPRIFSDLNGLFLSPSAPATTCRGGSPSATAATCG